ncbi:hypothetical protein GYMLUDRAFT_721648 [Collybiopsis luxurians FD-317 M1]|nr:hypothetical protein GYMLUDRAFT_721648 [Collybiopsis luxurians FD-317 M1]
MNIIRNAKRRHNITLSTGATEPVIDQPSKKRALLIGINNTLMADGSRKNDLKMPHKDVTDMKNLLVEKYGYDPNDVVTLIDIDDPKAPQPTKANILLEMKNLVADPCRGDHFFFHYSGHVVQTPNLDHTEEDGQDECLVPCDSDGVKNLIMDDLLRDILVAPLPQGCQLVAVLDSCHSGSLLDLEHFRCNRVWVPWVSKGRRKSNSMWNNVRRHDALVVYQNKRISGDRVKQRKTTLHPSPRSPLFSKRRESFAEISTAPTSPMDAPVISPASTLPQKKLTRALTKLELGAAKGMQALRHSPTWRASTGQSAMKTSSSKTIVLPWLDTKNVNVSSEIDQTRLHDSPVQEFCSGWCSHTHQSLLSPRSSESPEIISLASCKDSQEAWEDSEGHSMTQMLVEILSMSSPTLEGELLLTWLVAERDPNPTLKDLMVTISHKLHTAAIQAHTETKKYKKKVVKFRKKHPESRKPSNGDTDGLNMNNFQDPQLSSARPLDMDKRWNL